MVGKQDIRETANKARILLWAFVLFVMLCVLGVPTLFNLHIDPLGDNIWLTIGYILLDNFHPETEENMEILNLSLLQEITLAILFIALTVSFSTLIWNIDRLFKQYSLGNIFTQHCIEHFYRIGIALIAIFAFNFIGDNITESVFMELERTTPPIDGDPGGTEIDNFLEAFLALDFSLLLAGVFVVVVARVMQLGVALQDDVDSTI